MGGGSGIRTLGDHACCVTQGGKKTVEGGLWSLISSQRQLLRSFVPSTHSVSKQEGTVFCQQAVANTEQVAGRHERHAACVCMWHLSDCEALLCCSVLMELCTSIILSVSRSVNRIGSPFMVSHLGASEMTSSSG
ncbi:hypothetical protein TcWFU_001367 [Taenia crassiceps]|uniref:Uncharacterized protein n=1 Tax=Taenia crassiceps TaxID=6207 RepID=A0ABR4Q7L7_9CEST